MKTTKFKVVKTTKNSKGGFVWTLQVTEKLQAFGVTKTIDRSYYIGNMPVGFSDKEIKAGKYVEDSFDRFDIQVRPYVFGVDASGNRTDDAALIVKTETRPLAWLHVKAGS